MRFTLARRTVAEALGTFIMVFAGTGAIVIDGVAGGPITHFGIAATFGLVVMAMIYALGDLSGAHLNPAVSLGFCVAGRQPPVECLSYIGGQVAGAMAASALLHALFPSHETLGATSPLSDVAQSFVLEIVITSILMFVILMVSTGAKEKGIMAGIAIGGTVGLLALFAGPICGASMNPARSIGPAVVSGRLEELWLYIVGPILGAVIAVVISRWIHVEVRADASNDE